MKRICMLSALIAIVVACNHKPSDEECGKKMLTEARRLYSENLFEAARDTILSLRATYPTAFEARRQAILLMDSIEIRLSEGDSLKHEFYQKKLEHDKSNVVNAD